MDNMDKIRKQLITAALIGQMASVDFGTLLNSETKITIGDKEMKYEGKPQRMRVGDIVALGAEENDMHNYRVLKTETRANEINLKEVYFFKAKISTGHGTSEVCVVAESQQEAMKIVRKYSIQRNYKSLISLNPASKFFKPIVTEDDVKES